MNKYQVCNLKNNTRSIISLSFYTFLLGEPLDEEEAEEILRECCDSEDEDGFITYESKFCYLTVVVWLK